MRRGYLKGKLFAKGSEVDRATQPINFKWTMRMYWALLIFGLVMLLWVVAEEIGLLPRTLEG